VFQPDQALLFERQQDFHLEDGVVEGFLFLGMFQESLFSLFQSLAGDGAIAMMARDGGNNGQPGLIENLLGESRKFDSSLDHPGFFFDGNHAEQGGVQESFLEKRQALRHLFRRSREFHSLEAGSVLNEDLAFTISVFQSEKPPNFAGRINEVVPRIQHEFGQSSRIDAANLDAGAHDGTLLQWIDQRGGLRSAAPHPRANNGSGAGRQPCPVNAHTIHRQLIQPYFTS